MKREYVDVVRTRIARRVRVSPSSRLSSKRPSRPLPPTTPLLDVSLVFSHIPRQTAMVATVQKPAPAFKATAVVDGLFQDISLSDYLGKW